MSVAVRKTLGDIRHGWGRVLLLLMAVAIGQAAMTASVRALVVVQREIDRNFQTASAPDATIEVSGFDGMTVDQLAKPEGVAEMETRSAMNARYRLPNGTWRTLLIFGRRDFTDLRASRVFPQDGAWPPGPGEILIEQSGLGLLGRRGQTLEIGFGRGQRALLKEVGAVHDPAQAPSWQENALYGYTDLATLRTLSPTAAVQILIKLAPGGEAGRVTRNLVDQLTERGARVTRVSTLPATHPHADLMTGLLMLLAVFSLLSFVLTLFLTASLVAALTQKQDRQFAVLRVLGASRVRIGFLHLAFVLVPGLAGLALGAALGDVGAVTLQNVIAAQLNISIADPEVSARIRYGLLLVGLGGMLLALAAPILSAVSKPIRHGLQNALTATGRPAVRLPFLKPLSQLAVAEAFGRPLRSSITVLALTVAGVALLTSTNMFVSLVAVVDRLLEARNDNIAAYTTDPPDPVILRTELGRIDGMQRYELWDRKMVTLSVPGAQGQPLLMISPPPDTRMGLPPVIDGRWPSAPGEIALSSLAIGHNSRLELKLGSNVVLTAGGRSTDARIVGLVDEFGMAIWAGEPTFGQLASPQDRGREIRATVEGDKLTPALLAVERAIVAAGAFPSGAATLEDRRATMVNHYWSFYQFLLVASLTAGVVGAAALAATIGSNVLERTREIAILRTLGATSGRLFWMVLVQAIAIALLSLALAITLSLPLSSMVVEMMAKRALRMDMPMVVSWTALIGWGLASLLIAALAALAPTVRINRLSIRETVSQD